MPLNRRQLLRTSLVLGLGTATLGCSGDDYVVTIDSSLPVGPFDADSTGEEVTAGLDLSGRVALVTGCNSGLGLETMRVLGTARRPCTRHRRWRAPLSNCSVVSSPRPRNRARQHSSTWPRTRPSQGSRARISRIVIR